MSKFAEKFKSELENELKKENSAIESVAETEILSLFDEISELASSDDVSDEDIEEAAKAAKTVLERAVKAAQKEQSRAERKAEREIKRAERQLAREERRLARYEKRAKKYSEKSDASGDAASLKAASVTEAHKRLEELQKK